MGLDSILKSRDITLPTRVRLVKAMVFPVVMYICESWTMKKAEHRRIDAFELWCWRRLLRGLGLSRVLGLQGDPTSPFWRRSALGFLGKVWCYSWNSNTLATSCKELIHWKRPWCWEGLGPGGKGDDRGWDGWMASLTRCTWVWVNSGKWWWTGRPGLLQFMGSQRVGHNWATELNWTELMGPDAMTFIFWMLSFKPAFSLSSFTFIKRLSSSSLSAIRVVSFAYLRLLIFLPAILIPACALSTLAFLMMCSAYKLNKQGDNIQPWCTPFPVWNRSVVLCPI